MPAVTRSSQKRPGPPAPPTLLADATVREPAAWTRADAAVLAAAIVVLVLFRWHAFPSPLETDECNYAYVGERLLAGDRLYVEVWDHQPPGMFALAAGLIAAFGAGPLVFRLAATAAAAGTLAAVYAVCRNGLGFRAAALAAALLAIGSSDPGVAGDGCNREVYMNLLGAVGLWLAAGGRRGGLAGAGLCLGLSSLLKPVAALPWLGIAAAVVVGDLRGRERKPLTAVWSLAALAAGPALVWLATFAYFGLTDRLEALWEATFAYNVGYARVSAPILGKLAGFFSAGWGKSVFKPALALWLVGGGGLMFLPWRRNARLSLIVAGFTAGNFVAVCLPGHFWHHYFLLLQPSLAIGAAALYARWDSAAPMTAWRTVVAPVYAGCLTFALLASQFVFYLAQEPDRVAQYRYGPRMVWARAHARQVAQVTAPGDAVYVCGIDSAIYYYGQRRCATRYLLTTMLLDEDQAGLARRRLFLDDLRKQQPRLIMLIRGAPYVPELDTFIRENKYLKVGEDPGKMDVLCDPQRPIEAIDWTDPTARSGG